MSATGTPGRAEAAGPGGPEDGDDPTDEFTRPDPRRRPTGRGAQRLISERLAEAASAGPPRGTPNASAWQRSHAVWHRAGVDWSRPEPEQATPRPVATTAAGSPPAPAAQLPPAPREPFEETVRDGSRWEPRRWEPPRRARRLTLPRPPVRVLAIGAAVAVVLGGGAYALFGRGGDDRPARPDLPAAVPADALFTTDPAARASGRTHELTAVAASGGTAVAVGSEQGGEYSRGQFLTSFDGGRGWRLAKIQGGEPREFPRLVAGGSGGWAALGGEAEATRPRRPAGRTATTVIWTSRDARTWTRQPSSTAFGSDDTVNALTRTRTGFVAVGATSVRGDDQAVVWTSADGRAWQRLGADLLRPQSGGTAVRLDGVAAAGGTVVAHGVVRVTQTVKRKKKKVQRTVESEAFWQSADGGRSWTAVTVPQAQGSSGAAKAVVATPAGFFAVRDGERTTGKKKKKKTMRYGVVLASPDGRQWAPAGQLSVAGYSGTTMLRGGDSGLTALVSVGSKTAVLTSGDGKTWRRVGDLPPGVNYTGAALAGAGPAVTGRREGGDAYLTVAGAGDVNLAAVPDAVHPERVVAGVVADGAQALAVGSTNGDAALWSSPDGSSWRRVEAQVPALKGPNPQRLVDAAHGRPGWVAVGRSADAPLVIVSGDGNTWRTPSGSKVFGGGDKLVPAAAAAGEAGYVVVGQQGDRTAAAWYSTDLKNWSWAGNAGKGDLKGTDGAPKAMADVAVGQSGYVAVGSQTRNGASQPAVWTSADGRKWALSPTPPALPQGVTAGALSHVAARGQMIVATGRTGTDPARSSAFAAVSADGGRTWQPSTLPDAADTVLTAAAATPRGFVLAGNAGITRTDAALWTSADGRRWTRSQPHGLGLDGPGLQRINGLAVSGPNLVAVGFTGDYRRDAPLIWRPPIP